MHTLSRSEQETIITRAADEKSWHVFSEDPSVIRKLTRLHGEGKPSGQHGGFEWVVPKACVSFRRPSAPRVMTEDQLEAARARGKVLGSLLRPKA